jgi:hypothetical protein
MTPAPLVTTDLVKELRLRRWARENFVSIGLRDATWHADVLDEMRRKDDELNERVTEYSDVAQRIVPLVPGPRNTLNGPHHAIARSHVLARVPFVE